MESLKKESGENLPDVPGGVESCSTVTIWNCHNNFLFLFTSYRDICDLVHEHGGQVYLDGANLNAQVCKYHSVRYFTAYCC